MNKLYHKPQFSDLTQPIVLKIIEIVSFAFQNL